MGRFYCHCLNVTLSYRGDGRGLDRSSAIRIEELLGNTDLLPDQLLNKTLVTVSLDVAGIISVRERERRRARTKRWVL